MATVSTGEEGASGWGEDGERVPEIRVGVSDVKREWSSPGDEERVWTMDSYMKVSHCS